MFNSHFLRVGGFRVQPLATIQIAFLPGGKIATNLDGNMLAMPLMLRAAGQFVDQKLAESAAQAQAGIQVAPADFSPPRPNFNGRGS